MAHALSRIGKDRTIASLNALTFYSPTSSFYTQTFDKQKPNNLIKH